MFVIRHADLDSLKIDRITTRKLVASASGARNLEVWEQFMPPGGHIPFHYHECEEVITIIDGTLQFTIGGISHELSEATSVFIPPRQVHGAVNQSESTVHLVAFFAESEPRVFLPDGTFIRLPWQEGQ